MELGLPTVKETDQTHLREGYILLKILIFNLHRVNDHNILPSSRASPQEVVHSLSVHLQRCLIFIPQNQHLSIHRRIHHHHHLTHDLNQVVVATLQ